MEATSTDGESKVWGDKKASNRKIQRKRQQEAVLRWIRNELRIL
ncbi:hypothetical protein A2U01_0087788, partial [Trifolium medium]|nr:hypothetical protein [Trifolium medium]